MKSIIYNNNESTDIMHKKIKYKNNFKTNKEKYKARQGDLIMVPLSCAGAADASGPRDGCIRAKWIEHFANPYLSVVTANAGFMVCDARQNFYVFWLYRNPDLDDRIVYCLPTSIASVQADNARASYQFVGDLNGPHLGWVLRDES